MTTLGSSPVYIWSKYLLNAWSSLNNNTQICHAPHLKHQKFEERAGTISSIKIMIFANRKATNFFTLCSFCKRQVLYRHDSSSVILINTMFDLNKWVIFKQLNWWEDGNEVSKDSGTREPQWKSQTIPDVVTILMASLKDWISLSKYQNLQLDST